MTDHSIRGKSVLIAGGAKNLGGLFARDLAAQGARAVAIHYNSAATKAAAEETVAAIKAAGAKAFAFQADLTRRQRGGKAVCRRQGRARLASTSPSTRSARW